MSSYKKEFDKIYKKIDNVARKGVDGIFDWYRLIDELINNGQWDILQDVLFEKYAIVSQNFKSISDLKREAFEKVRFSTNSSSQSQIKKLMDQKGVYSIGIHYYDSSNNIFLGDIIEVEESRDWLYYKDPRLSEKQDQNKVINLEVIVGLSQSNLEAIANFELTSTDSLNFVTGSQVIYLGDIWRCTTAYRWDYTNKITPTFSSNWVKVLSPTYSYTLIGDDNNSLIEKYEQALDILKGVNYIIQN